MPGATELWLPGTACEVGIGAFMNEFSSEVNGPRSEDEREPPFDSNLPLAREVMHDSEPRTDNMSALAVADEPISTRTESAVWSIFLGTPIHGHLLVSGIA